MNLINFNTKQFIIVVVLVLLFSLTGCFGGGQTGTDSTKYSIETNVLSGSGKIKLSPSQDTYKAGTEVTVKAVHDEGYVFAEWAGNLSGSKRKQTITVDDKLTIGAKFNSVDQYNVEGLRVNADYKLDAAEKSDKIEQGTYWVPAADLGKPDNTSEELIEFKGKPEVAKEEIDVLFEALAYLHLCDSESIHNAGTEGKDNIDWEFPKPGKQALRDSSFNCASAANAIKYLLADDYEEVGYVWRHSAMDSSSPGGHVTSYIKYEDEYYFFDPVSLTADDPGYPVEDGDGDFSGDICDVIIQSSFEKYAVYWTQVAHDDQAIVAAWSGKHFALGTKQSNFYYPLAFDGRKLTILLDPQDKVELLEADYSPVPPTNQYNIEDYSNYKPYSYYGKTKYEEVGGEPEIYEMKTDG